MSDHPDPPLTHGDLRALDMLPTPVWIFDIQQMAMWWANRAALRVFRAESLEGLLGRDFSKVSEAVRTRLHSYLDRFRRGETLTEQWTLYPQGQPVSLNCLCSGVQIEAEGRLAMLVQANPIPATEAVDAYTLRCVEALRHTSVLISLASLEGEILLQNPAAERCYGHSPQTTMDLFERFLDPQIKTQVQQQLAQALVFRVETLVVATQGSRWHRVEMRGVLDPTTGDDLILIHELDITEQITSETALQRSESINQALIGAIPDLMLRAGWDGTYLGIIGNQTVRLYEPHQMLVGVLLSDMLPPEQAELRLHYIQQAVSTGQLQVYEYYLEIEGEIQYEEARIMPLGTDEVLIMIRDITERERARQVLAQREHYLGALVEIQRLLLALGADPISTPVPQEVLQLLGQVAGASRVYVFYNHADPVQPERWVTSRVGEWCTPGIPPQIENPHLQNWRLDEFCPRWVTELSQGDAIWGLVAELPEEERLILEPQEILSILVLPLIVNEQFQGFIGFDNCVEARPWSEAEVDLLHGASVALALALERIQIEAALHQSEVRNRALLEAIPDGMVILNRQGDYLDLKPSTTFPSLLAAEENRGQNITQILPTSEAHGLLERLHQVLVTQSVQSYEYEVLAEPHNYTREARLVPCGGEETLVLIRDITERKQSDEALQRSYQRYEMATRAGKVNVWDWDLDPEQGALSDHLQAWGATIHPEDRPRVLQSVWEHIQSESEDFEIEHRLVWREETRWVLTRGTVLKDDQGRAQRMSGTDTDITDRKQTERDLQTTSSRLSTLISSLQAGILVEDEDRRILLVNQALCELFKIPAPPDLLLGQDCREAVVGLSSVFAEPAQALARIEAVLQARAMVVGEEIPLADDRILERDYVPIFVQGQYRGHLWHYQDVSERKQILSQYEQAKEVAETANQAKSSFLATLSHEIRTPMNAVIGMTGLLLDTPLNLQQRDFVETIRTSGDALLTLINDILDFSKIESGHLELEEQPFSIRTCVEEALDLLASRASQKGLELAYWLDPQVPATVLSDATRLRQILVNLLSNAVKFTDRGEVVVRVTASWQKPASPEDEPKHEILFSVRDTGIGIPVERQDRLFKPFSQVDTSVTRQFGGTGLGLAISKRLAQIMGGRMWVQSQPGQGSTFFFVIQARAQVGMEPNHSFSSTLSLTGKRVLIVDDNATNRQILTLQLQAWGMEGVAMDSGQEALDALADQAPFDLAILDMSMPGMDGLTLATELHLRPQTYALPVIMLTSLAQIERSDRDKLSHLAAYLTKPVKQSQLFNVISSLLANADSDGNSDASPPAPPSRTPSAQLDPSLAERLPLRILLAEDNHVNQKVALAMLGRMGYRADVASNGIEVLSSLQRQPYDLVLMDVQMPEMDGLSATRQIRESLPADRQPWIVAMTANALQGAREECLEAGMNDYVSKPVKPKELMDALLLSRSQSQSPEVMRVLDQGALEELQELAGGDQSFMIEVFETYLQDSPKLLHSLQMALRQADPGDLKKAAHTLKSTSKTVGAMGLAYRCQQLEMIALSLVDPTEDEHHQLAQAGDLIQDIGQAYEKVAAVLRQECQQYRSLVV